MMITKAKILAAVMMSDGMDDRSTAAFVRYFGDMLFDDPSRLTEQIAFLKNEFSDIKVPSRLEMEILLAKADAVFGLASHKGISVTEKDGCMFAFEYGDCASCRAVPVKTRSDFMKYKDLI